MRSPAGAYRAAAHIAAKASIAILFDKPPFQV